MGLLNQLSINCKGVNVKLLKPAKDHSCSLLLLVHVVPWLYVVHTLAIVIAIIRIPLIRVSAYCFIALRLVGNGCWFSALQFKS
jgi:hypothetical protein